MAAAAGSSTTTPASPASNVGRERAIEILMDRDPRGSFYRAARVVEEAVPAALSSRPNLVTKSTLIDQAFMLAEYDIDTPSKYDAVFGPDDTETIPVIVDAVTRERILHHQQRLLGENAVGEEGDTANPVSSSLVAALRQVYDDKDFDWKQLLRTVTSHALLTESSKSSATWPGRWQDMLLAMVTAGKPKNDIKSWSILILALLVGEPPTQPPEAGPKAKQQQRRVVEEELRVRELEATDSSPRVWPVASLLSLLATSTVSRSHTAAGADDDTKAAPMPAFYLEPEWLEYFGQASAAYEERLEIQKARLLARLPSPQGPPKDKVPSAAALSSSSEASFLSPVDTTSSSRARSESPPPLLRRMVNSDDDVASAAALSAAFEQVLAGAYGPSSSSSPLAAFLPTAESGSDDGPDHEESSSDEEPSDDGPSSDSDRDDGPAPDGSAETAAAQDEHDEEDGDEEDDDDDEEEEDDSSDDSSSSSQDAAVLESERGIDETTTGSEYEEDAVLRQALTMSLAAATATALDIDGLDSTHADGTQTEGDVDVETLLRVVTAAEELPQDRPDSGSAFETPISERSQDGTQSGASSTVGREMPHTEESAVEDASLPCLPKPPLHRDHPFHLLKGVKRSVATEPSVIADADQLTPFLDPSALSTYGSLPEPYVLIHLLRYMTMQVERRRFANFQPLSDVSVAMVSGGMGSTLFGPTTTGSGESRASTSSSGAGSDSFSDEHATLQLLVATLLLIVDKRDDAIENLRKAIAREHQAAKSGGLKGDDDEDDDSDHSAEPLSSGEEDDPALTLAMNYVEDDVPLSSESLENKGMRRKAAAAAHDTAALLRSLHERTEASKDKVKLYSQSAAYAMKTLRLFLQDIVRRSLAGNSSGSGVSQVDAHQKSLPVATLSRLSTALGGLMSIHAQSSYLAMLQGEEQELEEVFLSFRTYTEAVLTWVECAPLSYPSEQMQMTVLRSLIDDCSVSRVSGPLPYVRSFDALVSFPSSEHEIKIHKLQILCRRLRVGDMLGRFVANPMPFVPLVDEDEADRGDLAKDLVSEDPNRASTVVSMLGAALNDALGARADMQRLYLALSHRCHTRVLLFDGLYSTTETEADDVVAVKATAKSLATGDTVRVSSSPSGHLQFDATKCADSIAILSGLNDTAAASGNGPSVHQRASKVWGSVLSAQHYNPKSGVHRWAVRLDKCERGHVFIGVSTTQASMKTYVGGDKYGWGMIGTQALWHDRRKIRGDYGATFRTGSTIIVTLDTDAGTLSFSSWKDSSSSSSSFALDSASQTLASPRRLGHVGGTVEDWGVAFEGLPLDSRLYPAVGLYQRDDKVTLLTVESGGKAVVGDVTGECFYPRLATGMDDKTVEEIDRTRRFNNFLSWDGIQCAAETLAKAPRVFGQEADESLITAVLPSLAAALCLVPRSVPILSTRLAYTLLPHLLCCIDELGRLTGNGDRPCGLFSCGPKEGKWSIRATGASSSSSDFEEYIVDFMPADEDGVHVGFGGSGIGTTGKSKNGLVSIIGTTNGSSVTFVEEWSDGNEEGFSSSTKDEASSCVVSARMSLDGERFEGTYRNVQYGTTGHIVGMRKEAATVTGKPRPKDAPASAKSLADLESAASACKSVLCLAYGHLATIIGEDAAADMDPRAPSVEDVETRRVARSILAHGFFSCLGMPSTRERIDSECDLIKDLYGPPSKLRAMQGIAADELLLSTLQEGCDGDGLRFAKAPDVESIVAVVDEIDGQFMAAGGMVGSLSALCPDHYNKARRLVVCVLLHLCDLNGSLKEAKDATDDELCTVWRGALQIVEDRVRRALSLASDGSKRDCCRATCEDLIRVSEFLLSLDAIRDEPFRLGVHDALNELAWFYRQVRGTSAIEALEAEMSCASRRAILTLLALKAIDSLVMREDADVVESICVGLPRLLGRGHATLTSRAQLAVASTNDCSPDLDGNYLSMLGGASCLFRSRLQRGVVCLYERLGRALERDVIRRSKAAQACELCAVDSSILALLSIFGGSLRRSDISDVVKASRIVALLPKIIDAHRFALVEDKVVASPCHASAASTLQAICQRDISRAILRCCVAVAHVVSYQTAADGSSEASSCLELMLAELRLVFPVLEANAGERLAQMVPVKMGDELERWIKARDPSKKPSLRKEPRGKVGGAGVAYLREYGTMLASISHGSFHKSTRAKGPAVVARLGSSGKSKTAFCHQYLSHWLHVLCATLRFSSTLSLMATDITWLQLLLRAAGLILDCGPEQSVTSVNLRSFEQGILPAKFRSRILRLATPLLMKMSPSQDVVEGLLGLSGFTACISSKSVDEEECFVSRESISILRCLHSPASPISRVCVNAAIRACVESPTGARDAFWKKIGCLSFFSGDLSPIQGGSYVLLKPSAAVPLSQENQSSPNAKGHSGSVAGSSPPSFGVTPHHIGGNGTESIVAGLCRLEASAGIVSSIDLKNGVCEVILVTRDYDDDDLEGQNASSKTRSVGNTRHTLTVRALRTPLSDVVLAQEMPLYLDKTVPFREFVHSVLRPSLESLLSASEPGAEEQRTRAASGSSDMPVGVSSLRSGILTLASDVMVLRSCIVLFSDRSLLSMFMDGNERAVLLSNVLKLAWPEEESETALDFVKSARSKFLSSIPAQEARFGHVLAMIREASYRLEVLDQPPAMETIQRLEEYRRLATQTCEPAANLDELSPSSPKTPPPSSGRQAGDRVEMPSRDGDSQSNRSISQSTGGSNSEDEEENEAAAAATAAAHLREAAIAQMAELGLPRSWSELALRRTGGTNIEAAVTFCLERGGEMERLLAEERERERMQQRGGSSSSGRRRGSRDITARHLLRQLQDMGFPSRWCAEALAVTGNNVDEALTWILTNGERLSEEDEGMEADAIGEGVNDDDDDDDDEEEEDSAEDDEDETEQGVSNEAEVLVSAEDEADGGGRSSSHPGWTGSVIPLRFISGRASVNPTSMEVSGLPSGGFSSVGTKGVMLTTGKWYYEAVLETAGCLQIGWADGSFAGHCNSDRGDGCGDGPSSWAYDGWRRYRWHSTATEWGCRWKEGDVVGCLVDMDAGIVSFHLNGEGESVGMGIAFSGEGFRPCGGVYACVSFNRREKLRLILGGSGSEPFRHSPPEGYRGVGEAVMEAVNELDSLLEKEIILDEASLDRSVKESRKFLCDFSDGEHGHELMAWAHRYYGSDASVHLGSGRAKLSSGSSKSPAATVSHDLSAASCVSKRVEKIWSACTQSDATIETSEQILAELKRGYDEILKTMSFEIYRELVVMAILLARKMVLHIVISLGADFDPTLFVPAGDTEIRWMRLLWKEIEACASLRSAGWVGEAGSMAIAAEALGLGISSTEQTQSRSSSERAGMTAATDLHDGLYLPTAGITQLLSSVTVGKAIGGVSSTGDMIVAGAEAAIGSDSGGGLLSFLREGLEGAARRSSALRSVLLATIRRSVRLLAVVEYDNDPEPTDIPEDEEDSDRNGASFSRALASKTEDEDVGSSVAAPDARLVAFLSGLLLHACDGESAGVHCELAEAWSLGLLSGSLPWRMICSFTVAGILSITPQAFCRVLESSPTLARYFGRLPSAVARRIWAERAASPVCSRYIQAMVELLSSVKRGVRCSSTLPDNFTRFWDIVNVDAATPLPLYPGIEPISVDDGCWEAREGWISSDNGWEIWSGKVEYMAVDWKTPSRSGVRTLMDAGQGPPMLGKGCTVMRGADWTEGNNEDGNDLYEVEKAKRDQEKRLTEKPADSDDLPTSTVAPLDANPADPEHRETVTAVSGQEDEGQGESEQKRKKKRKKPPSPKLPLGTVLSVEPWNGVPAMGRRVRWHLTGNEGVYRFGGDGGRYDISHVEGNEKETRIKKRHPLPESAEQCAARHGFGARKSFSVILRLRTAGVVREIDGELERHHEGILEWPDFGAGARVTCVLYKDGAVSVEEHGLVFGPKDSGWEARFGQPSFTPGSVYTLVPTSMSLGENQAELDARSSYLSMYDELLGSTCLTVPNLRNRENGDYLKVTSEMKIFRPRREIKTREQELTTSPAPAPPLSFDADYHASSISLSRDGRTASCSASDGRGTAFASTGFTKGVHYWEVKLEQADIGSVFVGVAEKPSGSGSGSSFGYDAPPRLNRWHGWGFVNFRATYTSGAERVYGAHCHAGDTVGVLLDCDNGRVSFFFDGLKYGEHILNDLGCAFENLSPFGFNVDGCGSGGAGQGAPSGFEGGRSGRYPAQGAVRPRTLWPVIGLRNQGDRVTLSAKWNTSFGVDGSTTLRNIIAVDELLNYFSRTLVDPDALVDPDEKPVPAWFLQEAFAEYKRWFNGVWQRSCTRGSGPYELTAFGLDLDLDASPKACAAASAGLGLNYALLSGDRVRLTRSAGRILELAEEAVILGAYQGRLYYKIVSQKSEGGSLMEGGGRAWCLDESEVVDGLHFVKPGKGLGIVVPKLDRFKCLSTGGLRVVYEGGAVLRSDLEIFDGSSNLGSIPFDEVVPREDVLERRVNSCGVVRYRVRYGDFGEGWISAQIRGGKEEPIVEPLGSRCPAEVEPEFRTTNDAADAWYTDWRKAVDANGGDDEEELKGLQIQSQGLFAKLIQQAKVPGLSQAQSDSALAAAVSVVSNYTEGGNAVECPFREIAAALSFVVASSSDDKPMVIKGSNPVAAQAAAAIFADFEAPLPPLRALLARIALLKAFNRRAQYALPWLPLRPCQEGSAILGGLHGRGTSVDRAGRSRLTSKPNDWIQVPCIASRIRSLRGLFFASVKRGLLSSITEATTTPTPLSHDEYELPREIRTVRINRLKAARAMASDDQGAKRKYSVFAQLQSETRNWGGAALRRGYVAKGHGGQKRAFKVKLIGEGVNDYSGPYREAFTDAIGELLKTDPAGNGELGVLDATPNNAAGIGNNRDLFMFSLNGRDLSQYKDKWSKVHVSDTEAAIRQSFASLLSARDEASWEVEEALVFLGRITGTAYRHGIPVDLPLALESVWKALTEEFSSPAERLREIDHLAYRQLEDEKEEFSPLLWWQQRMLNSFVEGLSNVLPVEVLPLMTGEELRDTLCGNPEVDVDLLRRVVEYEGYEATDEVIDYFWQTLREFSNEERKQFLQFVWARNRLPMRESDFDAPFKIQKDAVNSGDKADEALPSASTCFFSLTLPHYSSQEILKKKLLFAISNVTTMETDFQTNSAEISEGYRTFW